jgi:hypothetical protein
MMRVIMVVMVMADRRALRHNRCTHCKNGGIIVVVPFDTAFYGAEDNHPQHQYKSQDHNQGNKRKHKIKPAAEW